MTNEELMGLVLNLQMENAKLKDKADAAVDFADDMRQMAMMALYGVDRTGCNALAGPVLAMWAADQLHEHPDAENYLELSFSDDNLKGHQIVVTIQKEGFATPGDRAYRLSLELEELRAKFDKQRADDRAATVEYLKRICARREEYHGPLHPVVRLLHMLIADIRDGDHLVNDDR